MEKPVLETIKLRGPKTSTSEIAFSYALEIVKKINTSCKMSVFANIGYAFVSATHINYTLSQFRLLVHLFLILNTLNSGFKLHFNGQISCRKILQTILSKRCYGVTDSFETDRRCVFIVRDFFF